MQPARNHHFISQCYLKGFAAVRKKAKLYAVDLKERCAFRPAPAIVAVQRDFNRIDVEGVPIDALEKALAKFEDALAPALARIIATRSIADEDDRIHLLNLVGLLATKSPRNRRIFTRAREQTADTLIQAMTSSAERWNATLARAKKGGAVPNDAQLSYEQARKFVDEKQYKIEFGNTERVIIEMDAFNETLQYIVYRKWRLLRSPPGKTGFVTTDHPVCLMWSKPQARTGPHLPGLGLKETLLLFPISNELAAVGAFELETSEADVDEERVAAINGAILTFADRQIYARDENFLYRVTASDKIRRGDSLLHDPQFNRKRD